MRTRHWTPLALLFAFGFSVAGCTSAYGAHYRSASYGHVSTGTVHYDHDRYTSTPEYRRISRDADLYADFLDRELHLDGRQEQHIERLLRDRTRELLRYTAPRDHYRVYPFPRDARTPTERQWWNRTDSLIERTLYPPQRHEYRRLVYALEHRSGNGPWRGNRGY